MARSVVYDNDAEKPSTRPKIDDMQMIRKGMQKPVVERWGVCDSKAISNVYRDQ